MGLVFFQGKGNVRFDTMWCFPNRQTEKVSYTTRLGGGSVYTHVLKILSVLDLHEETDVALSTQPQIIAYMQRHV